jgi:hypothetical protein
MREFDGMRAAAVLILGRCPAFGKLSEAKVAHGSFPLPLQSTKAPRARGGVKHWPRPSSWPVALHWMICRFSSRVGGGRSDRRTKSTAEPFSKAIPTDEISL